MYLFPNIGIVVMKFIYIQRTYAYKSNICIVITYNWVCILSPLYLLLSSVYSVRMKGLTSKIYLVHGGPVNKVGWKIGSLHDSYKLFKLFSD